MISINKYIAEAMDAREAGALDEYNKAKKEADKAVKVGDAVDNLGKAKLEAETLKSKLAAKGYTT